MLSAVLAVALSGVTVASDSRCNDITVNKIQGELQNYADHPVPASQLNQRGTAIVQAQSDAEQEQVVLQGVCPQSEFPQHAARLFAIDAWGDLLVQRNITASGGGPCPNAVKPIMAASAASAWYKLGQASQVTPPPKLLTTLVPQVQALATEAGMALPVFADVSVYWEQTYETAAKQAIAACSSATPMP
ncbi:MAG TPA: hypothetical protein VMG98_10575 [Verrucomicrobiae bacterium]|nr:hypothetical protein [Verrucomicrobiae bacterium]